jgi:hypothetical protein
MKARILWVEANGRTARHILNCENTITAETVATGNSQEVLLELTLTWW